MPGPQLPHVAVARSMLGAVLLLLLVTLLAGCSAPARPEPPSAAPPSATVQVPPDGVSLADLGFRNGPVDAFTLPRSAVLSTRVDQPNGVTVVLTSPSTAEIADYLRRVLPETGFTVTGSTGDSEAAAALTFTGYGWHGSFTGTGSSSAVVLRP